MLEHGTTEHGTPAEQRNNPEQGRNNWTFSWTPAEHPRISTEYRRNTSGAPAERRNHTQRVQANQLNSVPPLKPSENLWFPDNSREYRSQIIHSNAPMGESPLPHQGWTITLVFSKKRKIFVLKWKHALLPFWLLSLWLLCELVDAVQKTAYSGRKSWWCFSTTKTFTKYFPLA